MQKTVKIGLLILSSLILSACGVASPFGGSATGNATVMKSIDGGTKWEPKIKIDAKKTIASVDVLSMAINPLDPNIIYIGTASSGIFVSKDGGESWTRIEFPSQVYGLVLNPSDPQIIYASAVYNGRGKIFKRTGEDQQWNEIYTEPLDGTMISSLGIDRINPQVLYAGTNAGVIIKTVDGGSQWSNLPISNPAKTPVVNIAFDAGDYSHVYFSFFKRGIFETRDGVTVNEITNKLNSIKGGAVVYSLFADPYFGGVVYVGTNRGIFKGTDGGNKWEELNIIESSRRFPIRAIAVNVKNSKEIVYSAGKAIYKSTDGGAHWSTFQLNISKDVSVIKYDNIDATKVYAGFRTF